MRLDDDLQGHPDGMRWLTENRAAIAAYEEGRHRRERIRVGIAVILSLWGVAIVAAAILNLLQR